MYKLVIIEDDLLSREILKDILEDYNSEFQVVEEFEKVLESVEYLKTNQPDLVLLDMELADGKGFDILEQLEQFDFEVIIITMHNSFMLEAIKHSALDYLLKPISKDDLSASLLRFENKIQKINQYKNPSPEAKKSRLVIPNSGGLIILEIKNIIRLESDGAYTNIFTVAGKSYMVSKNLGYYESLLEETNFFRSHHKHLINLSHIKSYHRSEGAEVQMSDQSKVLVSRRKKELFLKLLTDL